MANLLDVLIGLQNKSGSIPSAPHTLKNLKGAIVGVPFQILTPGMSGVMSIGNILGAINALAGILKIPALQSVLGAVNRGLASLQTLTGALGNGQALGLALSQYGSGSTTAAGLAGLTSSSSNNSVAAP